MKKATAFRAVSLVVLLLTAQSLFASDGFDIVPVEPVRSADAPTLRGPAQQRATDGTASFVLTLRRYLDDADYYLSSGAAGDTFVTYFKPIAPCSIVYFEHEMYDGGTGAAFLWAPNPAWQAAFPNGQAVSRTGQYISPIGDVLHGPVELNIDGPAPGWVSFMPEGTINILLGDTADSSIPDGQAPYNGGFLAGWVKGGESPLPLTDDVSHRGFTYTWFGGPWTADDDDVVQWGWYNVSIENMVDIGVIYGGFHFIMIRDIVSFPNTLDANRVFTFTAEIIDPDGWNQSNEQAYLLYEILDRDEENDTTYVTVDSLMMEPIAPDDWTFSATLDLTNAGLEVGDRVNYWINTYYLGEPNNSLAGAGYGFDVVGLSKNTWALWIDDGGSDRTYDQFVYRGLLDNVDPDEDYIEYWNVYTNGGFDETLINAKEWDFVVATGVGLKDMPFREPLAETPFADYLTTTSGSLCLFDEDYLYAHSTDEILTFEAGEFAYDVFGIASGHNDPEADTLFEGEGWDEVSSAFPTTSPYRILSEFNYSDYIYLSGASSDWFYGCNDANTYGSVTPTQGGGYSYYLGFPLHHDFPSGSMEETQLFEFYTQLLNMLSERHSVEDRDGIAPARWSLSPAYPNPFNPSTNIAFNVPEAGRVTLEVFDITGRLVTTLTDDVVQAGQHHVAFDGQGLASGTYLVRMQGSGFNQAQKIVLLK